MKIPRKFAENRATVAGGCVREAVRRSARRSRHARVHRTVIKFATRFDLATRARIFIAVVSRNTKGPFCVGRVRREAFVDPKAWDQINQVDRKNPRKFAEKMFSTSVGE